MAETGMAAILSAITSIVTSSVTWVSSWIGVITSSGNEFLMLMLLIPFVGLGIGLVKRLIRL